MLLRCLLFTSCLVGVNLTTDHSTDSSSPAPQIGKVVSSVDETSPSHGLVCLSVSENPTANIANDEAAPAAETNDTLSGKEVTSAPLEVSTGSGIQDNCMCGVSRGGRVVGGQEMTPHEFPWLVALTVKNYFTCGGSLITEKHVLTAAHCVEGTTARKMEVTVGLHNIKEHPAERKTYSVISAKAHYLYWNGLLGIHNDIAILELNDTVTFSSAVRPICLPKGNEVYKGKPLTVAGWGHTSETGFRISNVPLKAEIKVLGNKYCRRSYWNLIFAIHICAGTEEGGKDACQGDSGGPLMSKERGRWVQAGVVSYGKGCARKDYPGLYTRVNQFLDWIERNTKTAKLCRMQRDNH